MWSISLSYTCWSWVEKSLQYDFAWFMLQYDDVWSYFDDSAYGDILGV